MVTTKVVHDPRINIKAARTFGVGVNERSARDGSDIRCPATDINDRAAPLIIESDAGPDRRGQPLLDHVNPADVGLFSGSEKRPLFHMCNTGQYAHHSATTEVRDAAARLAYEMIQHRAGPLKVSDNTIHQRRYDGNLARFAPEHSLRFFSDGNDLTIQLIDSDYRGFINYYAAAANRNNRASRPHVDCHRVGNHIP
jgi:hypothetical protein